MIMKNYVINLFLFIKLEIYKYLFDYRLLLIFIFSFELYVIFNSYFFNYDSFRRQTGFNIQQNLLIILIVSSSWVSLFSTHPILDDIKNNKISTIKETKIEIKDYIIIKVVSIYIFVVITLSPIFAIVIPELTSEYIILSPFIVYIIFWLTNILFHCVLSIIITLSMNNDNVAINLSILPWLLLYNYTNFSLIKISDSISCDYHPLMQDPSKFKEVVYEYNKIFINGISIEYIYIPVCLLLTYLLIVLAIPIAEKRYRDRNNFLKINLLDKIQ